MKRNLIMSVAAAALMLPAVANAAECDARMSAYDESVMADPKARQQIDIRSRQNLRELRDAAVILQMYGQEEACEEVVEAIQNIASDPEAMAKARGDKLEEAQANYDDRARMRAEKAVPITEASRTITADDLLSADLHGMNGEDLGSVEDLVMGKDGQMSYLIVGHGGFLGVGEKQIAVPFESAKISQDNDVVFINATEESLEKAPAFDRGDRSWLHDAKWRETNWNFFNDKSKEVAVGRKRGDALRNAARRLARVWRSAHPGLALARAGPQGTPSQ